ncbi:MAG: hypothetical protein NZ841_01195 [Dictyoglomus sp.]|nr:hypothetical protein [Dictyoglomus sp.]MDW8187904.1 hypothetical protein [Dictyoglomus sp.]
MIFDLICVLTIIGLALKGLKEIFSNKIALILSIVIAFFISSALLPFYMKYLRFPPYIPSNIFAFILTFIFSYILLALPSLILSVIFGGSFLIIAYGVILKFLPYNIQSQISQNSIIFSFIKPVVEFIYRLINYVL